MYKHNTLPIRDARHAISIAILLEFVTFVGLPFGHSNYRRCGIYNIIMYHIIIFFQ